MPFISSPVAYPPSSSPAAATHKRKRTTDGGGSPLKHQRSHESGRRNPGLFVEDEDEDDQADGLLSVSNQTVDSNKENAPPAQITSVLNEAGAKEASNTASASISLGSSIFSQAPRIAALPNAPIEATSGSWTVKTTRGEPIHLRQRRPRTVDSYQEVVAARSETVAGKARRSYYGIEINSLIDQADAEIAIAKDLRQAETNEAPPTTEAASLSKGRSTANLMWTEKYRAKKFTDLVGDDRTHRTVMHWLKAWDQIVFPGAAKRSKKSYLPQTDEREREHRKVLLLTGPPGLGKTTLAHVCARQAGYEVTEINASDERSKDVVKGRIKDMLGTENVKAASDNAGAKKVAKPICVIVDEVDGVVSGSGGSGEGGFVKALIDLVLIDQRNSRQVGQAQESTTTKKKKGDRFRMQRPLIMICNDAYHPALRLLRTSQLVEIIHCGRPALNNVANRVKAIFEREGVTADADAVRRLCEGCWGTTSKKEGGAGAGSGDGDIRSVLVMGEWVARRIRAGHDGPEKPHLTKKWLETNMTDPSASGVMRGLGRGGNREIVDRIFMEGAGLSRSAISIPVQSSTSASRELFTSVKSVNEALRAASSAHLRTLIDGHGETDKIMSDLFSQFPSQPYQDDTFLTKPTRAYEWLNFHDALSSAVFGSSEWELAPYLSSSALAFHSLFSTSSATRSRYASDSTSTYAKASSNLDTDTPADEHPFSTAQASHAAFERERAHAALLGQLHACLSLPLTRLYPRPETMAAEFIPFVLRMISPAVNPVLITSSTGGQKGDNRTSASVRKASEKALVDRAVTALLATGLRFTRHKLDGDLGPRAAAGWTFRLSLPIDDYAVYPTAPKAWGNDVAGVSAQGNRYGVRQVLVQECAREERRRDGEARKKRSGGTEELDEHEGQDEEKVLDKLPAVKRDFFGRELVGAKEAAPLRPGKVLQHPGKRKVWVSFHEGYSNAVRKPITLAELLRGL